MAPDLSGVALAQRRALERLRNTRDGEVLRHALDRLRKTARGADNIFPALLVTVKARATLGEIADVFREIFGEYRPS